MKLEYLRLWQGVPQGSTRDCPDGVGNLLISRGICKPVEEKKTKAKLIKRKPKKKTSK